MSNEKQYNPYESVRRVSEMWEKGLNGLLFQSIDNNGLIQMAKHGIDAHSRYIEILRRNQELMANYMNLSTKSDVANVAKLTIQAEEKMDILEEQIWNLQESFALANKEQHQMLETIMDVTKKMQTEWVKVTQELGQLSELKNEFEALK
jgi:hypothetical protein